MMLSISKDFRILNGVSWRFSCEDMSDSPDIGGPTCPNCGSDNVQRIEGGAVGIYRCLGCNEEFDADDDSDHAKDD